MDEKLKKTMVLVVLNPSKQQVIIPLRWIQHEANDMSWIINWGLKTGRDRKVYFSNDKNDMADFNLPTREHFSVGEKSCYLARVVKACGERCAYSILQKLG